MTTPHPTGTTSPVRPEVRQLLDRAVHDKGLPGIAAEIRNGGNRSHGTAGVSDITNGAPRRVDEQFRIGSTTKTFVAVVILQLAAEHRLDLDDTVETWLPGLLRGNGNDGRAVTIRQLLSMTSGIFNYSLDQDMIDRFLVPGFLEHRFDLFTPEDLVAVAMTHAPDHEPGQGWTYSNTGYILAGMIIERVSGETFAEQVARRIIRPLHLGRTYVPGRDTALREAHARHYSKSSGPDTDAPLVDVTEMSTSTSWSAGGMVSTVTDLAHFVGTLLRGGLLPPAQQELMFAVSATPPGKWIANASYGLGMASVDLPCGQRVWGMGGAINGSYCFTFGTRDGEHLVAQHVNGDWDDPIGIFTEVLDAEFAASGTGARPGDRTSAAR